MSHFDDLMQMQGQKEMSVEEKKKAEYAGKQSLDIGRNTHLLTS